MEKKKYRVELHCHTKETSPCSTLPAVELVRLYKEEGYDGIVTSDHFTAGVEGEKGVVDWQTAVDRFLAGYHAAKKEGERLGVTIYLGAEIRFPGSANDYLVYGFTEELLRENEWLYEMDLPAFYRFAEEHGLFVAQAHPFREMCTPADPRYLHGVEVYNGHKGHSSHNERAEQMAAENSLIPIVGSDCHYEHAYGTAAVCFERLPQSVQEITALLKAGEYSIEIDRR